MAVLIDGRAADDRMNAIAIEQRPREPLQHDHAGAFAAHIAVGARIERLAAAVRRQHSSSAECDRDIRRENDAYAADERSIAFARQQRGACDMQRDER